jgi:hypothetical protein
MFGQDRQQLRRFFQSAWDKRQSGQRLEALEQLVSDVIAQHPEYHNALLGEDALQKDFSPDDGQTNPWLHMGMHISLGEQLGADRPAGIRDLYQALAARHGDTHAAEHAMMDCLGIVLWEAQRNNAAPDEAAYLECIKKMVG